jgi:hypothetical protein
MAAVAASTGKSTLSLSRLLKMDKTGIHTMKDTGTRLAKFGMIMLNSKEESQSLHQ